MGIKRKALGLAVCLWALPSTPYASDETPQTAPGPRQNLHVYLLIGQSNMAGRAPFTGDESKPIERCFLLDDSGHWEPAANPLNRYSTIRKDISKQKMGPGYHFAQTMLEVDENINLGLVVNARGGSEIEEWAQGSKFYQEALRRVSGARKTGTLKGILWHQGEADVENPDKYIDKLSELVSRFRKDLALPELPFIAGQIDGVPAINEQTALLPDRLPFTGFVSSEGLTIFEEWHFDAASVKLMGKRYAEEMLKIQSQAGK
ncbi:MAG: sialate O-acetylesterase [Candidatus Marinimicrobia bacterium]|nr:sialate O-acetylesterase [Candidatus Neomarinimicrobiota bacterium]